MMRIRLATSQLASLAHFYHFADSAPRIAENSSTPMSNSYCRTPRMVAYYLRPTPHPDMDNTYRIVQSRSCTLLLTPPQVDDIAICTAATIPSTSSIPNFDTQRTLFKVGIIIQRIVRSIQSPGATCHFHTFLDDVY